MIRSSDEMMFPFRVSLFLSWLRMPDTLVAVDAVGEALLEETPEEMLGEVLEEAVEEENTAG